MGKQRAKCVWLQISYRSAKARHQDTCYYANSLSCNWNTICLLSGNGRHKPVSLWCLEKEPPEKVSSKGKTVFFKVKYLLCANTSSMLHTAARISEHLAGRFSNLHFDLALFSHVILIVKSLSSFHCIHQCKWQWACDYFHSVLGAKVRAQLSSRVWPHSFMLWRWMGICHPC